MSITSCRFAVQVTNDSILNPEDIIKKNTNKLENILTKNIIYYWWPYITHISIKDWEEEGAYSLQGIHGITSNFSV